MRPAFALFALSSALATRLALAADLPASPSAAPGPSVLQLAREAIRAKDWKAAETQLRAATKEEPRNADAWNLLGYTLRWQERYEDSLAAYGKAFEIDPQHLGAHEYIGRTYLKMGRKGDAEKHLATLRQLCPGCEETRELAEAVAKAK
jgi:Flp pilus assembly protein TadD